MSFTLTPSAEAEAWAGSLPPLLCVSQLSGTRRLSCPAPEAGGQCHLIQQLVCLRGTFPLDLKSCLHNPWD